MADMTDDLTDWIENANNGEGPTPVSTIRRAGMDRLLHAIQERADAETRLTEAVISAHDEGASWALIGSLLGMTRQGAHQRYALASQG